MYEKGKGVAQNYLKAMKWQELGAAKGDALALHRLGIIYGNGKGVARNPAMAYIFSSLAYARGLDNAENNRDSYIEDLTRDQIAETQKIASEWKIGAPLPTSGDLSTYP